MAKYGNKCHGIWKCYEKMLLKKKETSRQDAAREKSGCAYKLHGLHKEINKNSK